LTSTPEKPRPSLADTLARIDATLAEPEPPVILEGPMPGSDITKLNVLVVEPGTLPRTGEYFRGLTENGLALPRSPYLQPALDEAARQSAAQLAATVKRINAKATAPPVPEPAWGWFGRLLNRLIP
jgi:hypothetical protein